MTPFFITGLPRCKSAWLANWLTWGNSFCFHDTLRYGVNSVVHCMKTMMVARGFQFCGLSDPAAVLFWKQLRSQFPDAKWIVVNRPIEESLQSSRKAFGDITHQAMIKFELMLDELCEELHPFEVDFHDEKMGLRVARHIGMQFDPERFAMLNDFQVQIEPSVMKLRIDSLRNAA